VQDADTEHCNALLRGNTVTADEAPASLAARAPVVHWCSKPQDDAFGRALGNLLRPSPSLETPFLSAVRDPSWSDVFAPSPARPCHIVSLAFAWTIHLTGKYFDPGVRYAFT
jgi:hypothetical protein